MHWPGRPGRWALVAAPLLLAPEFAYWAGSRLCAAPRREGSCKVLVLGYPAGRDGQPRAMQSHRVTTAAATMERADCERMILSGGNPHSNTVESDVMEGLAQQAGVPQQKISLERRARNTWENIGYSLPFLEGVETIYIVSDSIHAHRGRRYLCRQRPDLCDRALAVARYRFAEMFFLKFPASLHEGLTRLRDFFLR